MLAPLQTQWTDALEKAKPTAPFCPAPHPPRRSAARVAKAARSLGSSADVQRFVQSACARLNAPLEPARRQQFRFLPTQHLPEALRQRLADEGLVPEAANLCSTGL
jgi:hypothetical protein